MSAALDLLEHKLEGEFFVGEELTHADIAVACAVRFTREAHPGLFDVRRWSRCSVHSATMESTAPFKLAAPDQQTAATSENH